MTRYFNTEGICKPTEHYMVSLDERLEQMRKLYVDRGKYFVINRGRQFGKTTTLISLAEYLKKDYIAIFLDFQGIGSEEFAQADTFVRAFADEFALAFAESAEDKEQELLKPLEKFAQREAKGSLRELFLLLSGLCKVAEKPVVLMIDEVDNASNNQVFIDFLAQLRKYYLARDRRPIFHSVILAGVYDIKNLKQKIRPDSEHQYNSPWNIAADFDLDMSFSKEQIAVMLDEYKAEHNAEMDVAAVADEIFQYTSGYPFLVSAICKIMDEKLPYSEDFVKGKKIWTKEGIEAAVKIILNSKTTLFDSMIKHVTEYPDLKQMLYAMLFQGERVGYNQYNHTIELACMFGYVVDNRINIQVSNRIFEICLYNLFLSEDELSSAMSKIAKQDKSQFILDGKLNMEWVLRKFVEYFHDIYGENDDKFVEDYGRKFFLLYLRPIINGIGNYYIEAQTRDAKRTDVVIDYAGEQFVIEMKIWHGNEYNERDEQQLADYLDYFHQTKGYLLSFNFNKKKEIGLNTIMIGEKIIVEAVV